LTDRQKDRCLRGELPFLLMVMKYFILHILFVYLFFFYYSYVHTRLGSFLPPAPTPSLTTHPPPPSPLTPLNTQEKLLCPFLRPSSQEGTVGSGCPAPCFSGRGLAFAFSTMGFHEALVWRKDSSFKRVCVLQKDLLFYVSRSEQQVLDWQEAPPPPLPALSPLLWPSLHSGSESPRYITRFWKLRGGSWLGGSNGNWEEGLSPPQCSPCHTSLRLGDRACEGEAQWGSLLPATPSTPSASQERVLQHLCKTQESQELLRAGWGAWRGTWALVNWISFCI
jgi:hypothetical protein